MESEKTLTLLLGNNLDKLKIIPSLTKVEAKELSEKLISNQSSMCDYSGVSTQDLLIKLLVCHKIKISLEPLINLFQNINFKDIHNSIKRVESKTLFIQLLQREDFFKAVWGFYFRPNGSFPFWFSPNEVMKKYQKEWFSSLIKEAPVTLNLNKLEELVKLIPEVELIEPYLKKSIGKIPTKILINRIHENYGQHMFDEEEYSEIKYKKQIEELVREELKTREHINNKEQSRLIRKMSIHAGRKLNLKEAQELEKSLKND